MDFASAALAALLTSAVQTAATDATGDPVAGKALFEGRAGCIACHSLETPASGFGPDLTWIGILRTPQALRRSLIDPDDQVFKRYFTIVIETKTGETIKGLAQKEDERSIQIREPGGRLLTYLKSDLRGVGREERSLMPSYASTLSAIELEDIVAFLRTQRAIPPVEPAERTREIGSTSENIAFFDRPGRDAEERPDAIIEALEIPQGGTVADLGAGTGYFTWRLAQAVGPSGKVLAIDVQPKMLALSAEAVRGRALTNVDFVLATHADPRLPTGALDMVFIAYAYHEFSQPEATMAAVRRSLKPGGRLFVLEFAKENRLAPASSLHKMSLDEIRQEIEPLGFDLDRMLDFLPLQHGLIFKKRF